MTPKTKRRQWRDEVFERDGGVCASCGLDTQRLADRVRGMHEEAQGKALVFLQDAGFRIDLRYHKQAPKQLWDVDHIRPLAEGGRDDLDNLQTLCHVCHRAKTLEQRQRKAKRRRIIGRKQERWRELLSDAP